MTSPQAPEPVLHGMARFRMFLLSLPPAKMLLFGYALYMVTGWILLALPFAQEVPVAPIDTLFIATSAVSTTGLVTVDPGTSFTLFGEIVIILLIQAGGLGYMTLGSFAALALQNKLSPVREKATRSAFNLPEDIKIGPFIRSVVIFTLICEAIGALILYFMFRAEGVEGAVWSAIFHAISAFCTAGFSLNSTSLEAFRDNAGINIVVSVLCILGAMGFLIVVDGWRNFTGKARHLGFTSKVIVRITMSFLLLGTIFIFVADASLQELAPRERLLAAFFQTMTASTTVGFNTHPISAMSLSVIVVLFFLMVIGASPSGTGGGLKTTSFAALVGLVRSTLKGRERVRFAKRQVRLKTLQTATAGLAYYMVLMLVAMMLLFLTEPAAAFEVVMFEVISALGTVGLSLGITGDLSVLGKVIVIILMTAGRVGILTFGIAIAAHDESREEERDNELVC
ncbi:TrkH family potassium uptake protein [Aestuariibius sp. 2305UL40-4]|uniref:TrkH family potassium uptake protein n=1 Tax=Aestuariibius violaceus TaxID=3234132 RepID=UPI00345EA358